MAGITLEQAQTQLDLYLEAEAAVLRNQAYSMPDGRTLTRANLREIRDGVDIWDARVKRLAAGGARSRMRGGVPAP